MTTQSHKQFRGTMQEYEDALTSKRTGSADIRGMPTHPQQLLTASNGRAMPSMLDKSELYDITNRVRQFDMAKKDDVEAYEQLMDCFTGTPIMRDGQQVHFVMRQEETNFFAGKYGVLVKWMEGVYDPGKQSRADMLRLGDFKAPERSSAVETSYVQEYTPEQIKANAQAFGIQLDAPAKEERPTISGTLDD